MITTFLFEVLFGFIGMFVIAYFSRFREYRADAGGAKYAGREKMVAALRRLQAQYDGGFFDDSNKNMNAMKISSKSKGIMQYMSTHPSLDNRIQALELNTQY